MTLQEAFYRCVSDGPLDPEAERVLAEHLAQVDVTDTIEQRIAEGITKSQASKSERSDC